MWKLFYVTQRLKEHSVYIIIHFQVLHVLYASICQQPVLRSVFSPSSFYSVRVEMYGFLLFVRELIPRYVQQNLGIINTVLCIFDFQVTQNWLISLN